MIDISDYTRTGTFILTSATDSSVNLYVWIKPIQNRMKISVNVCIIAL